MKADKLHGEGDRPTNEALGESGDGDDDFLLSPNQAVFVGGTVLGKSPVASLASIYYYNWGPSQYFLVQVT